MKVGLFFGSFNPIHIGHMIIANTMVEHGDLDQVWFVVSPQNPLKKRATLLHEFDRYDMVRLAIADNNKLNVTDVEFHMPKPSYTADTLAYLTDKHPNVTFSLIMGEDNLKSFHKWKNYEHILENYGLLVYPRMGDSTKELPALVEDADVKLIEAPLVDISATFIRDALKKNKSIRYLVNSDVENFIKAKKFYH